MAARKVKALTTHSAHSAKVHQGIEARERPQLLTPREEDVPREVITGAQNKQIANRLGIALRTVKIHRSRVMAKMEADSVVDLARLVGYADELKGIPISPGEYSP